MHCRILYCQPCGYRERAESLADELRTRYLAGEASMFLVHGNVRDLVPWTVGGRSEWVDTRTFLERFLSRTRDRSRTAHQVDRFAALLPRGALVLDVGAGPGFDSAELTTDQLARALGNAKLRVLPLFKPGAGGNQCLTSVLILDKKHVGNVDPELIP